METYQGPSGVLAFLGTGALIGFVVFFLFVIVVGWKIFEKAGKPGWAVLVPIYSLIVFLDIVNRPTYWILLFLLPFVNVVILVIVLHRLSLSFGKDVGMTILLCLLIGFPIIAFGDARYTRLPDEK